MQITSDIRRLLHRAPLDEDAAARLWGAILDDAVDDIEIGATVAALAVSGETREELMGLYSAVRARLTHWSPAIAGMAISIPAYGLVPGESLIVSLAAALLRRFDVPVVIHGVLDSPCGVSSACVLRELGILPCASLIALRGRLGIARWIQRVTTGAVPVPVPALNVDDWRPEGAHNPLIHMCFLESPGAFPRLPC